MEFMNFLIALVDINCHVIIIDTLRVILERLLACLVRSVKGRRLELFFVAIFENAEIVTELL